MKKLFKLTSIILIQAFLVMDFAWGSEIFFTNQCSEKTTLSPAVVIDKAIMRKVFLSSFKKMDDFHTRDENLTKKYQRILRWVKNGKSLEDLWNKIEQKGVGSKHAIMEIRRIITKLRSHNTFGKIINSGKQGDRFVVFEVPGISREGFGIKDLNNIFGYELNTKLIETRSKILYNLMKNKGLIKGEEEHVYSTYKEDVYLIKKNVKLTKETLNDICQALIIEIDKIFKDRDEAYYQKFRSNGIKITEDKLIVYAINTGVSNEIESNTAQARLLADINAHQAITIEDSLFFTIQAYKKTIKTIDKLRKKLVSKTDIFMAKENLHVLKWDISKLLRKNISWSGIRDPMIKKMFKNNEDNYLLAERYFSLIHIQDYIKKWQVDFQKAKERADSINELVDQLNQFVEQTEEKQREVIFDKETIELFSKARKYLSTSAKMPSVTSEFVFHGQAVDMEHPVVITLDVKNMGLINLEAFEVELQRVSEALKNGDTVQTRKLWMSAADEVTKNLQNTIELTKHIIMEQLEIDESMIVELLGGDEFTLIIDKGNLSTARLAELLNGIKWYIQQEAGLEIRVAAVNAVNTFRKAFRDRTTLRKEGRTETAPNYLAHAKAITNLDKEIEWLKNQEENNIHNTIAIQDETGKRKIYKRNSLSGTPNVFTDWIDGILQENTTILSSEELEELAKQLGIKQIDFRLEEALARAKSSIHFVEKLSKDDKLNVYILRDAIGLYSAHRLMRQENDPAAVYLSKKSFRSLTELGLSADVLIYSIIDKAMKQLGKKAIGREEINDQEYAHFKVVFISIFQQEAKNNPNLRKAISRTLSYFKQTGILNKIDSGARFIDTTEYGTFPLFLEGIFSLPLTEIGLWDTNFNIPTETLMYYSGLSEAIRVTNNVKSARNAESDGYPVKFLNYNENFVPVFKETLPLYRNILYFQTVILRNEWLRNYYNDSSKYNYGKVREGKDLEVDFFNLQAIEQAI